MNSMSTSMIEAHEVHAGLSGQQLTINPGKRVEVGRDNVTKPLEETVTGRFDSIQTFSSSYPIFNMEINGVRCTVGMPGLHPVEVHP